MAKKGLVRTLAGTAILVGTVAVFRPLGISLTSWLQNFEPVVWVIAGIGSIFAGVTLWRK